MVLYLFLITLISVIHQTGAYQVDPTPPRQRRRQIAPPFPDGPCGGKVITIPPQDTFGIDVKLSNINIGGDLILPPRSIKVWVPPKYKESEGKHPVLYVHDGQNAIEDASSWTGASWRLTGALVRLREYGYLKNLPIVVMLESAEGDILPGIRRRHLEYGDTNVLFAQAHADFVANTVKPLIDSQFRTNPKESYAIGSSMGGNASLHLLLRHGDLFCGAACLSPFFGPSILNDVKRKSSTNLKNKKIYIDIGGDVGEAKVPMLDVLDHMTTAHWWNPGYFWLDTQLQASVDAMKDALDQGGVDYYFQRVPGGRHNERAWAQRIEKPLLHLFASSVSSMTDTWENDATEFN